jgi:hypothetical protein
MDSAMTITSALYGLWVVLIVLGVSFAIFVFFTLPGETKGCGDHPKDPDAGCGTYPSRFTAVHWCMIFLDILIFTLAYVSCQQANQYTTSQFESCLEEMCTRCDATICAVFSGNEGYPSTDINESWIEQRTRQTKKENPCTGEVQEGTKTVDVRVYKQIPGHILFTSAEKGRRARKLV